MTGVQTCALPISRELSVIHLKVTIPMSTDNLKPEQVEKLRARTINAMIGELRKERLPYRKVKVEARTEVGSIAESNGIVNG